MKEFLGIIYSRQKLAIPKRRHAVILFILIRPIMPTNLPLAHLCMPKHFYAKLAIALSKSSGSVPPSRSILRCSLTCDNGCSDLFHSRDAAITAFRSSCLNITGQIAEEILLHTDGIVMPINAACRLITSASQGYPIWRRRYCCILR